MQVLLLFLLAPSVAALSGCGTKVEHSQGTTYPEDGITQFTSKYGDVHKRWGAAKLAPFTGEDLKQKSTRCAQASCIACGWKVNVKPGDKSSYVEGAEDCLYASVFKSLAKDYDTQPTVFHVHHGQMLYGFKTELQEVQGVVRRNILVSNANFRVGVLGFLAHPDVDNLNAGQHDLMLALSWVKENICKFGGDPGHVTITGSSSGASQVAILLASAKAVGLFQRAWINSIPFFGSPDFFSQPVGSVYEKSTKHQMSKIGCGTLKCMSELSFQRLIGDLLEAKSPLVTLGHEDAKKVPMVSLTSYDGLAIPNMQEVARTLSFASGDVPVAVGQAANELDTLKFQFPLSHIIKNLVTDRTIPMGLGQHETNCLQRNILNFQGLQETSEDFMFNTGGYLLATRRERTGPRWHFLYSAPGSISNRAWHTGLELLSWSPSVDKDSAQYDHLTKNFVMGKTPVELRRYVHDNFVHFVRKGQPKDLSWPQTVRTGKGKLAGLPSKLFDQNPLAGRLHYDHHHSNLSVAKVHEVMLGKPHVSDLDMKNCAKASHSTLATESLRQELSIMKKSDMLFSYELMKLFSPMNLIANHGGPNKMR
jgi:carboxylesterase type B